MLNDGINSKLVFQLADTTSRRVLEDLDVASYDHVVTLSYSDDLDAQSADSRTLITLLHLRDMAQRDHREFPIVSEMQDVRNRELATVTDADDFIVSEQLVSLMMSQVAENKDLGAVLQDLFDPDGAELYLKPGGRLRGNRPACDVLHGARSGAAPRRNGRRLPARSCPRN